MYIEHYSTQKKETAKERKKQDIHKHTCTSNLLHNSLNGLDIKNITAYLCDSEISVFWPKKQFANFLYVRL